MGAKLRRGPEAQLQMPPGFRFRPTDEELIVHYLCKKAAAQPFTVPIIAEVDLYKFDPWDLPEMALLGEKEWYFFSPRDRKYPNGSRPNRAAGSGFWKATGVDKPISTFGGSVKVGVKKSLVFYKGRAPKGVKTNWIMHEYRLADSGSKAAKRKGSLRLDGWVLCRIYNKTSSAQKTRNREEGEDEQQTYLDDVFESLSGMGGFKLPDLFQLNALQELTAMELDLKSETNPVTHRSDEESGHDSVGDDSEESTWSSSSMQQVSPSASRSPPPAPLSSGPLLSYPAPLPSRPLPPLSIPSPRSPPPPPPPAAAAPSVATTTTATSIHPVCSPLPPPLPRWALSSPPTYTTTPTTTIAAATPATCGYPAELEPFPFNFDGLASPFGRLEPLPSSFFADGGELGGYFGSLATQHLQRLD